MVKHQHKAVASILSFLAWFLISYLIVQAFLILVDLIFKDFKTNWISKFIVSIPFYALFIFLLVFVPHKFFKKPLITREKLGLKGLPTWSDILLAIVGFIVYAILTFILTNLFEKLPFFTPQEVQCDYLTATETILAFLSIVIFSPIAEEIIFRGWLYSKLRNSISGKKSRIISILLVSLIFAIVHGDFSTGIAVFVLSVVACLIRELTGTIYGGILVHMIMNTLAFYSLFIFHSCCYN